VGSFAVHQVIHMSVRCGTIHNLYIFLISLQRLFHILKKCRQDIIQISKNYTISKLTQVTKQQKEILDVLGCNHLVEPDYLAERDITSINA
jgi:hypothetical protein